MNIFTAKTACDMDFSILPAYGIDVEKGIHRCMNDWSLYASLLRMFRNDYTLAHAEAALTVDNRSGFYACIHELKGLSGNAAMTALYESVVPLVELMRADVNAVSDAELLRAFAPVQDAYNRAQEGIRLADRSSAG